MKHVALLHAYSARNRGDGLLVRESVALIREALGDDCSIVVAAADPESFAGEDVQLVPSRPTIRGYDPDYLRLLRNLKRFDLVVGVGGGYLRAGFPSAAAKMSLVMLPQLVAAAQVGERTVYLPQSIGPLRYGYGPLLRNRLKQLSVVFARDDRTLSELSLTNARRVPDLAALQLRRAVLDGQVAERPVMTIRAVRGEIPQRVHALASALRSYDGYVQSDTGGNDDRAATQTLTPVQMLSYQDLMQGNVSGPRVVVAMRLHAALMALDAGHYVVHLAYERKGFGAFEDLGLPGYVHHYREFDVERVLEQVNELMNSEGARSAYDSSISHSAEMRLEMRSAVIDALRGVGERTRTRA